MDTASLRLVMEDDGSEVTDDKCLALLPCGTILLVLNTNEHWRPRAWVDYQSGTLPPNEGEGKFGDFEDFAVHWKCFV